MSETNRTRFTGLCANLRKRGFNSRLASQTPSRPGGSVVAGRPTVGHRINSVVVISLTPQGNHERRARQLRTALPHPRENLNTQERNS